ncbi:MAG: hypothetical protein LBE35_02570, partial [Clostridiales bacterium]|nr:hypothetical protein [Clostridiales bacterium]
MKNRLIVIAVLLIGFVAVLLIIFNREPNNEEEGVIVENVGGFPQRLHELIVKNRKIALPELHEDFERLLESFQTPGLDADFDAEIARRIEGYRARGARPELLAHEEIIYEIDFLFDLLRYGYGAYQYFGGDEIFLPLREAMLAQLSEMSDPLSIDSYFRDLLRPSLATVISDNHFMLHNHRFTVRSQLYMNESYIIREGEAGFVAEIGGIKYRIIEDIYILPTLSREGEFVWAFGHVVYDIQGGIQNHPIFANIVCVAISCNKPNISAGLSQGDRKIIVR